MEASALTARWLEAWDGVGVARSPRLNALRSALLDAYSEAHRHYHTLHHLAECFDRLAELQTFVVHRCEVEIALWFHDAIFDTHRGDNEAASAAWAQEAMRSLGVAAASSTRVAELIIATRHATEPHGRDAKVVIDTDLGILAADPDRFAEYERQVRQEYAWVPEPEYKARRSDVLSRLLARPRLFSTPVFQRRYETRARRNIARSLERLASGG